MCFFFVALETIGILNIMLSPIYDLKPFDLMNNVSFYHYFLDNNSMPTTFNAGKRTIFFFFKKLVLRRLKLFTFLTADKMQHDDGHRQQQQNIKQKIKLKHIKIPISNGELK